MGKTKHKMKDFVLLGCGILVYFIEDNIIQYSSNNIRSYLTSIIYRICCIPYCIPWYYQCQ